MPFEAGKQFGHYIISSLIGAGGMGEVFLADDMQLDRQVALKILPEEFAGDAERMRRFVQEAKSASALNHPNIITIYEIGESGGTNYIATEFIGGETLTKKLAITALEISIQIASALEAAHSAGIVHRDIKPDNVMIRADGYVKVLDFGIAKLSTDLGFGISDFGLNSEQTENPKSQIRNPKSAAATVPGMILGTPFYMSPEQARGLEVDTRSDIFSLGVMIYEMAAGSQPFAGGSVVDVIAAVLQSEPKPLAELVKDAPTELEWIIARALRKNREERYQTMKGFLGDLSRLRQRLPSVPAFCRLFKSSRYLTRCAAIRGFRICCCASVCRNKF